MTEDKIMILKSDKSNKERLHIKVRKKVKNSFVPTDYFKIVNIKDHTDLALLFEDLDVILGAPIERAFRTYKDKKERGFPF